MGLSLPLEAGNTSSPPRDNWRKRSQAARERGRIEYPVFVSVRRAVRVVRSTSFQRRPSISPRRQPVSAKNLAAATATGHVVFGIERRASPKAAYSASDTRRWRRSYACRSTPWTGLSPLNPRRTAKENIAPNMPIARVAVPRPPVTLARPCLPVFTSALVAPSLTPSRKRSISARVTAATLSDPKSGLMCLSMRALSPARVLGFLVVCRRVRMRPASHALEIDVAEFADCRSCPRFLLRSRRVATSGHFCEKP